MDCQHANPTASRPWLYRCSVGVKASGAAGHWGSDAKWCERFSSSLDASRNAQSRPDALG